MIITSHGHPFLLLFSLNSTMKALFLLCLGGRGTGCSMENNGQAVTILDTGPALCLNLGQPSDPTSAVGSIPVFTISAPMSDSTASIWSDKWGVGTVCTPLTPLVFWAVSAEMAEVPKTPRA